MNFTPNITEYNLNAINDYNQFLQGHASFDVKNNEFEEALEKDEKNYNDFSTFSLVNRSTHFLQTFLVNNYPKYLSRFASSS